MTLTTEITGLTNITYTKTVLESLSPGLQTALAGAVTADVAAGLGVTKSVAEKLKAKLHRLRKSHGTPGKVYLCRDIEYKVCSSCGTAKMLDSYGSYLTHWRKTVENPMRCNACTDLNVVKDTSVSINPLKQPE